jgi:hypothetical protein
MRSSIRSIIAAVGVLAASAAQGAVTLTTAPLYDVAGLLDCRAVNVGDDVAQMTVQVRDYEGAVIESFVPVNDNPGLITGTSPAYAGGASCVFVIYVGKAKQLLAAANYRDANSNLVIVPAR